MSESAGEAIARAAGVVIDSVRQTAPRGLLAEATQHKPFSNGTEGEAWMAVWCEHCVHDHDMSHDGNDTEGCGILLEALALPDDEWRWPEAWLPEPVGSFALPSRLICHQFEPCHKGDCTGDPLAETRAAIAAEVTAWWKENA